MLRLLLTATTTMNHKQTPKHVPPLPPMAGYGGD